MANTTNISIRMISINNPNKQTVTAMLEAERIAKDSSVKGFTDVEELLADLQQ